jgi:uncharacterized repeat protein (TIGR01451 family)
MERRPMKTFQFIALLCLLFATLPQASAAIFNVVNANDAGPGSLRWAITQANGAAGPDVINFNIPPGGPQTIALAGPLPVVAGVVDGVVTIDGTTQPGWAGTPIIELNGAAAGGANGLHVTAGGCHILGLVINRFAGHGIRLDAGGGNIIEGNYIGTDPAGAVAQPNNLNGIYIFNSANNVIGGTTGPQRNVISGNNQNGVRIETASSSGNRVLGNLIGTGAGGLVPLGNALNGVLILGAPNNQIGLPVAGARNAIGDNGASGLRIDGATATGNQVRNNAIGTDPFGMLLNLGNALHGVHLVNNASGNAIGGIAVGEANAIFFNQNDGIFVQSGVNNPIRHNPIGNNGALGIDLAPNNPTLNDACDGDPGPNTLQNFPLPTTAISDPGAGATQVIGTLDSAPNAPYAIDFFWSLACDPSGYGEGEVYFGSVPVMTGNNCLAAFNVVFPGVLIPAGVVVTATATDAAGNTSEFSPCLLAINGMVVVEDNPDLAVAVAVAPALVTDTSNFTYSVTVSNRGPSTATDVRLTSTLPSGVTVASISNSAGACQVQGSNIVCTVSHLAALQSFNVQAVFSIDSQIFDEIEDFEANLRAEVSAAQPDLNLSNNVAVVSVVVSPNRDFGDAPDAAVDPAYNYPTRLIDNGARHRLVGPYFGGSPPGVAHRDPDPDGMPTLNADGDDLLDANDDEEGIQFLDPIYSGATGVRVRINAPLGGTVDAWIDFNRNGRWSMGSPEQIFTSLVLTPGTFNYTFNVPAGAVFGTSYARFRISTAGGLAFTGYTTNGEVQDHLVTITTPPIVAFNGLQHEALGGAQLSVVSNLLSVTPTGATGGLKVTLGDSDGYAAAFTGLSGLEATNASVQFSAYGHMASDTNNQLLSSLRIDGQGSNATLSVDFSGLGATQYQAFFYNGNAQLVGARTVTPPPGPSASPFGLFRCPEGDIRIASVRYVNGHWLVHFECIHIIEDPGPLDLADEIIAEFYPKFDPNSPQALYDLIQQMWIETDRIPGPILLNDAVYKNGALYSATGDALLQVTENGVTAPIGSNSTGGLVLHSGVSDLMSDLSAARFDENVLYTARMSVSEPTAPQISNRMLWAGSRIIPRGSNLTYDISASLTSVSGTQRNVATDFSSLGATQVVVEVYQNSNLVGSLTFPGGTFTNYIGTITGSNAVVEAGANPSGSAGFVFTFAGTVTFTAASGPSYAGNAILVRASAEELGNRASGLSLRDFQVLGPALSLRGVIVLQLDRGDAPAAASLLDARHYAPGNLHLGSLWDRERTGNPTSDCTGDDTDNTDDEEGVQPTSPATSFTWVEGSTASVTVTLGGSGYGFVGIWVDWNADDVFASDEFVACDCNMLDWYSAVIVPGTYTYTFDVPPTATGDFAQIRRAMRVRVSDDALSPDDASRYSYAGEVEDYLITVIEEIEIDEPIFAGLTHVALGGATLTTLSNGLQVSNLGSSGQDGVRINLGRSEGWRASVTREPVQAVYSVNIVGLTAGMSNQSLATLRIERQGAGLHLTPDFSTLGASQYTASFYDGNGNQVGGTAAAQNLQVMPIVPDCPEGYVPDCEWIAFTDSGSGLFHLGIWICDGCIRLPDGTEGTNGPVLCILTPQAPARTVEFLSAVEIRGGSTTPSISNSIRLTSEATRHLGLWHQFLGEAVLEEILTGAEPWNLRVGNIGASGQDGIETIVGGPEYIGELPAGELLRQRVVQLLDPDPSMWLTSSNSHVRWTVTGRVAGSTDGFLDLIDLTTYRQEQTNVISASFAALGATQSQVEVFDGPVHTGSFTLPGLGKLNVSTGGVARVATSITDGTAVLTVKWDTRAAFTPSSGVPLNGDRLRISAVNPTMMVEGLRSLLTSGANVESFALRGFSTALPQRPWLAEPRLLPGGRVALTFPSEPDVAYDIERSNTLRTDSWLRLGTVMGTDERKVSSFVDEPISPTGFYRIRVR